MEFEIYESELADYSLQDSPFYEANTPIIFGLTSTQSIFATNNSASMVDALNLSSKKSSIMMSAKCQSHKLSYERTINGNAIGKGIDGQTYINDAPDTPSKKRGETAERFYSIKNNADLDTNATENNIQPKKKRKCVSFLPTNYVQVNIQYFFVFALIFFLLSSSLFKPQLL